MYNTKDNIVALATTPGKSAISVVRCSGSGCLDLYLKLLGTKKKPRPNYAKLHTLYYRQQPVDQMVVSFFRGPKSFTGQDMIEFSCHGGFIVAQRLLLIIQKEGFRLALPGEFSYRAFIGGKIDLVQAEAIGSIINASSQLDSMYAVNNLKGGFSEEVLQYSKKIEETITFIEHELDFDENEIEFISIEKHTKTVKKIIKEIQQTLKGSFLSNKKSSNFNVVLAGNSNVGKSSLFNHLLGYERSIVTNTKGTTRDTVEVELLIEDVGITLIDTAGIRKTAEYIEKKGISRTYNAIKAAEIVLFVDTKNPKKEAQKHRSLLQNKKTIYVQNKIDIINMCKDRDTYKISIKKKIGLDRLFTSLLTQIKDVSSLFNKENLYLINSRQSHCLEACLKALGEAVVISEKTKDLVIFVSHLRGGLEQIEELLAPKDSEKIINNIFRGFCVGK